MIKKILAFVLRVCGLDASHSLATGVAVSDYCLPVGFYRHAADMHTREHCEPCTHRYWALSMYRCAHFWCLICAFFGAHATPADMYPPNFTSQEIYYSVAVMRHLGCQRGSDLLHVASATICPVNVGGGLL